MTKILKILKNSEGILKGSEGSEEYPRKKRKNRQKQG
jgi:hypothetical protein